MATRSKAQLYFGKIKQVWRPFAPKRIIPFCTPFVERPIALVIGMNHADFVDGGGPDAEHIATTFARRVPTCSTFLEHSHTFAKGLRAVCNRAGIALDAKWMGTNRCAVQTDSKGIGSLKCRPEFKLCQQNMDELLRQLIDDLVPTNVILAGRFACDLFFPTGKNLCDLEAFDYRINLSGSSDSSVRGLVKWGTCGF